MADCGCQGPCEQEPWRCDCERDCWVGDPEDYAACVADCDEADCSFPSLPGVPSDGYRPPDWATVEYNECIDAADLVRDEANQICLDAQTACSEAEPSEPCECQASYCPCTGAAQAAYLAAKLVCDQTYTWPDSFLASGNDIDDDESCCASILGNCYAPAERVYLAAAQTPDYEYLECASVAEQAAAESNHTAGEEGVPPCTCVQDDADGALAECRGAKVLSLRPFLRTRHISRATCERNEISDERPEDRKPKECGGRLHLCSETASAEHEYRVSGCVSTAYDCLAPCYDISDDGDRLDCAFDCFDAARACGKGSILTFAENRFDCCTQEYFAARNDHALGRCRLDCWVDAVDALDLLAAEYFADKAACGGDAVCIAALGVAYCIDKAAIIDQEADCGATGCPQPGDCPDCGEYARLIFDYGLSGAIGGIYYDTDLPPPGSLPSCV